MEKGMADIFPKLLSSTPVSMKNLLLFAFFALSVQLPAQLVGHWESRSPMPVARTNMAATSLEIGDTTWIYVFMGLDSAKACGQVMLDAWKYNTVLDQWSQIDSVPDTEGRIAASATGWNGKVYLIGGYKVFGNCGEFTSPRVDIYDPVLDSWTQGDSTPTPIDDHVQVIWRDSLIYTVSGWSQNNNTQRVQIYDPALDAWSQATPISGPGLFGHAGGLVGDTILYLDGVRTGANFTLLNVVWMGVINPLDPTQITWTNLGQHPGNKVYRGGVFTYGDRVIFTGGTNNAYNIDGIGYNGSPSVESGRTFGLHLPTQTWEEYPHNPDSVMDVREIVRVNENEFYVIGGMEANQTVTGKVSVFVVDTVLVSAVPEWERVDFRVYPNPFSDRIRWELGMTDWDEYEVVLTDMLGREIMREIREGAEGELNMVNYIPAGCYLLTLRKDDRVLARKRIKK